MLAHSLQRGDITATSTTTIQFSATVALPVRPIRLWAPSGRQAALTMLPTPHTISGVAGTRYLFAALGPPSGTLYSTASKGTLHRLRHAPNRNELDWFNGLRAIHPADGTLIDPQLRSVIRFVESSSATPPDAHHVLLGEFIVAGGEIASLISYESQVEITTTAKLHGQCRLQLRLSGGGFDSELILLPYDGSNLIIEGVSRPVPSAGVTVSSAGLTLNTFYDIYAYWTGSTIALEASTTKPTTHTDGIAIKPGDPTRTHVGYALVGPKYGPAGGYDGIEWSYPVPVKSRFNDPTPDLLFRYRGVGGLTSPPGSTLISNLPASTPTSTLGSYPRMVRGGILGPDEWLEFEILGAFYNQTGATHSMDVSIYFGPSFWVGFVGAFTVAGNVVPRPYHIIGYLAGLGATNAQAARAWLVRTTQGGGSITGGTANSSTLGTWQSSHSSIILDSTVDWGFDYKISVSAKSVNLGTYLESVTLRRMRIQ